MCALLFSWFRVQLYNYQTFANYIYVSQRCCMHTNPLELQVLLLVMFLRHHLHTALLFLRAPHRCRFRHVILCQSLRHPLLRHRLLLSNRLLHHQCAYLLHKLKQPMAKRELTQNEVTCYRLVILTITYRLPSNAIRVFLDYFPMHISHRFLRRICLPSVSRLLSYAYRVFIDLL